MALGIGPGDEVITPGFTYIATAETVALLGAKPVYVDIDPRTYNLDPALLEAAITPKTKAIIPVSLYGQCADFDAINVIAAKYGIPVIEDAAQSFGASYKGRKSCNLTTIACTSFFPSKPLGCYGDGGAIFTNDDELAKRAKSIREHGSSVRYYHDEIGYNYRMEGLQGAVLGVQLPHLTAWNNRRRAIAHRYHELLKDTPLRLPVEAAGCESVYHLYVVRHAKRDALKAHLEATGVGSALHYPHPLHLQKCFAHLGYQPGDFPVAERAARECLSLPIYPELTDAQVEAVAAAIKTFKDW